MEMLINEKKRFYLENGDYLSPKIEIQMSDKVGLKMVAKEKINRGEFLIIEKGLAAIDSNEINYILKDNLVDNKNLKISK